MRLKIISHHTASNVESNNHRHQQLDDILQWILVVQHATEYAAALTFQLCCPSNTKQFTVMCAVCTHEASGKSDVITFRRQIFNRMFRIGRKARAEKTTYTGHFMCIDARVCTRNEAKRLKNVITRRCATVCNL